MDQLHPVPEGGQPLPGGGQGHIIPVDADEFSRSEPGGDLVRMPGAAQGPIHINTLRADIQAVDALPEHHGNMMKFAHSRIASKDASSFSGVRFSCSKALNSASSQISACPARPTMTASFRIPA